MPHRVGLFAHGSIRLDVWKMDYSRPPRRIVAGSIRLAPGPGNRRRTVIAWIPDSERKRTRSFAPQCPTCVRRPCCVADLIVKKALTREYITQHNWAKRPKAKRVGRGRMQCGQVASAKPLITSHGYIYT